MISLGKTWKTNISQIFIKMHSQSHINTKSSIFYLKLNPSNLTWLKTKLATLSFRKYIGDEITPTIWVLSTSQMSPTSGQLNRCSSTLLQHLMEHAFWSGTFIISPTQRVTDFLVIILATANFPTPGQVQSYFHHLNHCFVNPPLHHLTPMTGKYQTHMLRLLHSLEVLSSETSVSFWQQFSMTEPCEGHVLWFLLLIAVFQECV